MPKDALGHGSNPRNGARADTIAKFNRMDNRRGPQGHVGPHVPNVMTKPFPNMPKTFSAQPGRTLAHLSGIEQALRAGANWLTGRLPVAGPTPPHRIPGRTP
jgi:hypothetical protein